MPLMPARVKHRKQQRGNRAENVARFDWARRQLVHTGNGRSETQPMPEGESLSDRLSFMWSFAFRPAASLKPGTEIRATLSDGRGLSAFRYRVAYLCLGLDALDGAAGRWLKVDRRGLVAFRRALKLAA